MKNSGAIGPYVRKRKKKKKTGRIGLESSAAWWGTKSARKKNLANALSGKRKKRKTDMQRSPEWGCG